jgi:hypothetical protein
VVVLAAVFSCALAPNMNTPSPTSRLEISDVEKLRTQVIMVFADVPGSFRRIGEKL